MVGHVNMSSTKCTLKVLSLNCWGVHYMSKKITERFQAIADEIERRQYDIVALQEVWFKGDYQYLVQRFEASLPHHHYFHSGVVGSGLCLFSRHPITYMRSLSYTIHTGVFESLNRKYPGQGEVFAGKGIACCRVKTPVGHVKVYNTHTEVEGMHHGCQLFQAFQFIADTCGEDPAFFCGDFNMKDHELPYLVITDTLGFTDVFADDGRPTCHHPHNIYRSDTPRRIDYIFFSNNGRKDVSVCCVGRDLALSGLAAGQVFNYSDHEGLEAVLEIEHCHPGNRAGRECTSIAKRFVGEALTADERSRYCEMLSKFHADVKEWKQTPGIPSLIRTSTRAYSIWAVCGAVLACMLLLDLAGYPFSFFLAALVGMSVCIIFAGMVFDMKRRNVLDNILVEVEALKNTVKEVETG